MDEEWRPIPGFDPRYEVSDQGRVRSWTRGGGGKHGQLYGQWAEEPKILKGHPRNKLVDGYPSVRLSVARNKWKTIGIHKAVMLAFVGPMPDTARLVRHLNGDPNDNRLENLAYGTFVENEEDKRRHGRTASGERNANAILTDELVLDMRARRAAGERVTDIAEHVGLPAGNIKAAINGQSWKHLPVPWYPSVPRRGWSKLTQEQINEIQSLEIPKRAPGVARGLAEKYGVHVCTIYDIRKRKQ